MLHQLHDGIDGGGLLSAATTSLHVWPKDDPDGLNPVEDEMHHIARQESSAVSAHEGQRKAENTDGGNDAQIIAVLKDMHEGEKKRDDDDGPDHPRYSL